jgi:hypothetical protein
MMKITHIFALLLGALCCFGMNSGYSETMSAARNFHHHIQGKVSEDRYYGEGNVFSIALPSKSNGLEIEDFFAAPNIGGVVFFNDTGFFLKLEIDELIPEVIYLITKHPEITEEILDAIFYELLIPQLQAVIPKLHLLHEQKVTLEDGHEALFAVIDLPETATLVDMQTGRKLDSKRGFLLFFSKDDKNLVNLSMQDTLTLIPNLAETAKASLNDRLLHHLLHYQSTFRLEATRLAKPKIDHNQTMP